MRRALLALAVAAGLGAPLILDTPDGTPAADGRVELVFLDVGQGDATLIRSPEGNVALVDAGNDGEVVPLLREFGVDTIDLLVATHPDFDHIGGIDEVLAAFPTRRFLDNGQPHEATAYRRLQWAVQASGVERLPPGATTYELGSVTLRILPPPGWRRDTNNESVGILVEFGAFTALLTGDAEVEELNYFLDRGMPDVTMLKASHHGARNGVTPRWLDVTRPEIVVISCGAGNAYGHPDPWALRYYEAVAEQIYRTDLDGHVAIAATEDGAFDVSVAAGVGLGGGG